MEIKKIVRLAAVVFLCQVFCCGFVELPCVPGFDQRSEFVFKVHTDHLHMGKILGKVRFNTCDGRSRTLFQTVDKRFDVKTDGSLTLKRAVTLHEGQKEFTVHAWDSSGRKHTVSVRIERDHNHHNHHNHNHHMDPEMNITAQESSTDDLVLKFPKSSAGLKRAKRGWVIPPISETENSRGPFPKRLVRIKSDYALEMVMIYKITGEGADQPPVGLFKCDRTGTLFVTQPLDREKKTSYKLVVEAESSDGTIKEKAMEIMVNVIDQNDNRPEFTQNPFNGHVHEAAPRDYEFMTVTATDADEPGNDNSEIRLKIISQEPPEPKPNMFDINSVTGVIRVVSEGLDREKWSRYTLIIQAADMQGEGLRTTATAVITITDSNDNAPQFEQTTYKVSVPENKVGAVVAKLTVTDGDEPGSPAWATKYRIISGDKGFFNVSTGPSQLEGIITTVKPLDYETTKQYVLSVIVENEDPFVRALPTSTATVTVNVLDVNEPPVFNPNEKIIRKPENLEVNSELVEYTATDPDTGKLLYKIRHDQAGWLSVVKETGMIKVKNLMDRESEFVVNGKYKAIILAIDDDQDNPATGTGTLVIELEDVNDHTDPDTGKSQTISHWTTTSSQFCLRL